MIAVGETTRFVGDVLATVTAETEDIARAAAAAIVIEYEVLEPVTDMFAALEEGSPLIHEGGNVLSRSATNRGDVDKARSESAFVASGTFQTQRIEHAYMEPETAIAFTADGGIELLSQGQGVYDDRIQVAKLIGLLEKGPEGGILGDGLFRRHLVECLGGRPNDLSGKLLGRFL